MGVKFWPVFCDVCVIAEQPFAGKPGDGYSFQALAAAEYVDQGICHGGAIVGRGCPKIYNLRASMIYAQLDVPFREGTNPLFEQQSQVFEFRCCGTVNPGILVCEFGHFPLMTTGRRVHTHDH